ncbi:MAG: 30S ribosomal protein S4 [Chloroflexi bacterium]|nr:30S ribosomal protein S4 [Chloroflexota bacterium]MDA1281353.1 30S ribosomal protein S4 [Chloroflexota bacterium]
MARYTGPKCKNCRRFGMKLCSKPSGKCAWERRKSAPGDKSTQQRRGRISEYGNQLREKQKARAIYGVLERQFSNYYKKASRLEGVTGDRLLQLLESRLDNVVYRLGFADSRPQSRQIVGHGHIQVNGKKVNIPSYQVKAGDRISWREQSRKTGLFEIVSNGMGANSVIPSWLNVDSDKAVGEVVTLPKSSDVELSIDTRQIVEFYSRK